MLCLSTARWLNLSLGVTCMAGLLVEKKEKKICVHNIRNYKDCVGYNLGEGM